MTRIAWPATVAVVLFTATIVPIGSVDAADLPPPAAPSGATDFAIRAVGGASLRDTAISLFPPAMRSAPRVRPSLSRIDLGPITALAARWGRVTSTWRSPSHNRAVGGVPNSWHLSGRAVDIARRAGVSHRQIAAAFAAAGYRMIESLDEGDHSHFAFAGHGAALLPVADAPGEAPRLVRADENGRTVFRMVFAPPSRATPARVTVEAPARTAAASRAASPPVTRIAMGDEGAALR